MKKLLLAALAASLLCVSAIGQGTPVKNLFGSGVPNANLASVVGTTYVDQSTNPATVYTCTAVTLTPTSSQCTWTIGGTSSGGPISDVQILSRNCNGQDHCTTVKWNVGTSTLGDATTTSASNIVTCPECKFLTGKVGTQFPPAVTGQMFFANDSTSAAAGVNTCVNNPTITFGGLNQTTISSVDSDTQVHVVGNAGTSSVAKACIAWGDDDTAAINAAWAVGGCTTALSMPQGSGGFLAPIFQKNTGCSYNGAGPYFGQRVAGSNLGGTYLVPFPNFNFTSITGGQGTAVACTTCTAAIGNYLIFDYRDFGIFGLGQQCGTLASTDLFLAGTAARLSNVNGVGWCGQGSGTTLVGFHFLGDEDLWSQGGANFFGSIPAAVDAHLVTFSANYVTGMTASTAGVGKCGLLVGNWQTGSNLYTVDNSTVTCVQLGNSGGTTTGNLVSMNSQINANPNGTADPVCMFVGLNSTATFNSNDLICTVARTNEGAISYFSTGATVRASTSFFGANGTADVITGAAGNTFVDVIGNTFSPLGAGKWNGLGSFITGSLNSTVFASLGTPSNGSQIYCPDCTIANPCAGSGTGAVAKRLNGIWVCN